MWPWRVKMPTQNLLRLLLLMMRIVLATVCCRFGSWGLVIKLNFCLDLKYKVLSRFLSWSSGEILKLKFGRYFAADFWLRLQSWILAKILELDLLKILSLSLVKFLKLKFDQDLYKNFWYELNPRVRCAFGNVYNALQSENACGYPFYLVLWWVLTTTLSVESEFTSQKIVLQISFS